MPSSLREKLLPVSRLLSVLGREDYLFDIFFALILYLQAIALL